MGCSRDLVIKIFTTIFYFVVIPACVVVSSVASVIMFVYSFKGMLFLMTGSISFARLPMPDALAISLGELIVTLVFLCVAALITLLYMRFTKKKKPALVVVNPTQTQGTNENLDELGDDFSL
jgi:hypothetical protein